MTAPEKTGIGQRTLWFFSFVGFLASIVALLRYFATPPAGTLAVEVQTNFLILPWVIVAPVADGRRLDMLLRTTRRRCDERLRTSASPSGAPTPRAGGTPPPDDEVCSDTRSLRATVDWLKVRNSRASYVFDYVIRNEGSDVGRQIRLASDNVSRAEILRGNRFVTLAMSGARAVFDLPDLNPGEILRVRVWSIPQESSVGVRAPRVSFQGPSPAHDFQRPVDSRWAGFSRRSKFSPQIVEILAGLGLVLLGGIGASLVVAIGKHLGLLKE
jgi:hypothetical protein